MKKGLIFGFMAVLSAVFLFIGCSQATDSDSGSSLSGERLVDYEATDEDELLNALHNDAYNIIGFKSSTTPYPLTSAIEIPAGKTVILFSTVQPAQGPTATLEVNGTLVVEGGGTLQTQADRRVRVVDGYIEVINGTIQVNTVVDIHGRDIQHQILGTPKAYFNDGILRIQNALKDLNDVKTAFSWVPKGELILTAAPTQPIKPSELTREIQTTATSRLTINIATPLVYDASSPDIVDALTVPVGMTFTTTDPLTAVKTLTVAGTLVATTADFTRVETLTVSGSGSLTANAALFNNVGDLTVSGEITANAATYNKVKTLTVDSPFNANAAVFASLESLTVNPGGAFATTGSIGSGEANAAGITITIKPSLKTGGTIVKQAGIAAVGSINKLKTSSIEGVLIAGGFTLLDASNPFTIAAGGTINGVTFPAESPIAALAAADTVTIEGYLVPADGTLVIDDGSTLIVTAGTTLTYNGLVTIAPGGSLQLATAASAVAKIAGAGTIKAGATTIKGDWEVIGSGDGTLTIESKASGTGATITAVAATGLKASAAGAAIIQAAGTNNNSLTISDNTTLDLNAVASISLVAAEAPTAGNPAKVALLAGTSVILTGADSTASGTALSANGGLFVTTAANDKALVSAWANVLIYPGAAATSKAAKIIGGSSLGNITATADDDDGVGKIIVLDKDSPTS
jgi:hypothetical protein